MSVDRDPVVPAPLAAALGPGAEPAEGLTILLLTVRPDGFPHVAMLSAGEVVTAGDRLLRLALWPHASAGDNLAARGQATLAAVVDGVSWCLRVRAREEQELETGLGGRLRCFACEIEAVTSDEAPYAVLESGVTFRLKDPGAVLPRWRQVRAALAERSAA